MATAKPSVSEKWTPFTLPCTKSEAAPECQLVRHVAQYNEILWYIGLEIKEENGLGELGIAVAPGTRLMRLWEDPRTHCESLAMVLLGNVLAHHRCIVAVELTFFVARNPFLLSILQDKYSVRKLTISDVAHCETKVLEALEKLVCPLDQNDADTWEKDFCFSFRMPLLVFPQPRGSISLTALDVADADMSAGCAWRFIHILLQNNTISDLTVGACVFTYGFVCLRPGFVVYLEKHRSPLKKLTVRTPMASRRALESLVKAIALRTTLEELVIDIGSYDAEERALLAKVVALNRTLCTLSVTWRRKCFVSSVLYGFDPLAGDAATRVEPWLLALPENTALSALTVDLLGFTEEECCAFFRALALNKTLKSVCIGCLPACADLRQICQIIRDSRLAKDIHIEDHHVSINSLPMLPECPEVTSLTVYSLHLNSSEILRRSFEILASCNHVTSLRVYVHYCFLDKIQAAMAAYIMEARTLKDIKVGIYVYVRELGDQRQHDPDTEKLLVNALASNLSLTRISVTGLPLSENNCEFLANAFVNSQHLSELSFAVLSRDSNNAFLQTLVSGIESNRSLLRVDLPSFIGRDTALVAIRNITRRNASLVNRAARFVMGDHDPYNARAVELVSGHERVLSIIQENAGVAASEAATMVRRALGLRCLTGLNEYMKLVGVVKCRVECIDSRGDSVQLDELSYDCWIHIRRFLTVADVVGTDGSERL
ncbi:hypothetical protein V5799_005365 [Amblyomma americanum]|uniref:Nlr family card domain protein n=1 Tax=Amblyomma americanum TaxID=6943 RepID=A0AAQ4DZH2_AMBAM